MPEASKRVLVIDDDDDFRSVVSTLLNAEGYQVDEATSGREGLARLEAVHPDLVIVDVMMESAAEGYGVSQALRFQPRYQELQDVPILMISSIQESPDEIYARASEVGMIRPDRYLTKPLDVPRFLQTVRQLVRPEATAARPG
jgi:two-component system alkaline phosphatase synthesis response regulator PhoP